jgi:DHA1 family multidrug resistance protein-like MFS transporter
MSQFWSADIFQFGVLQFLFGLFIIGAYPVINTLAVGSVKPAFQGRVFGLTTAANQFGSMTGPLIGGFLSTWIGIRPVFLITGGSLLFLGLGIYLFAGKSSVFTRKIPHRPPSIPLT